MMIEFIFNLFKRKPKPGSTKENFKWRILKEDGNLLLSSRRNLTELADRLVSFKETPEGVMTVINIRGVDKIVAFGPYQIGFSVSEIFHTPEDYERIKKKIEFCLELTADEISLEGVEQITVKDFEQKT